MEQYNKDLNALLTNCYRNSLQLAVNNDVRTIAFPNISTGIYHFPKQNAAEIATSTVDAFLKTNNTLKEVAFVCFDAENLQIYQDLLK